MTAGNYERDSAASTAERYLRDFGFTGWHLIRNEAYDPARDTLAGDENLVEREMAQAVHYAFQNVPARDDGAVFFVTGEPRPKVGDGLVAMTQHWLIEEIEVVRPGGQDAIYAVNCS